MAYVLANISITLIIILFVAAVFCIVIGPKKTPAEQALDDEEQYQYLVQRQQRLKQKAIEKQAAHNKK